VLHYAFKAGASGFLAGRAIWWKAFQEHYPDLPTMEAALASEGAGYLAEINRMTDAMARPWAQSPVFEAGPSLDEAGQTFPSRYPAFA